MRRIIILVFASMIAWSVSAQITWHVRGGVGSSSVGTEYDGDIDIKTKIVGKVGMGLEIPFDADWLLMSSLEIAGKGVKFVDDKACVDYDLFLYYAQIPINVAYRLNLSNYWNMVFKAGIYLAYAFSGKDKNESIVEGMLVGAWGEYEYYTRHFDFGLNVGIDFEYHRFVFGFEYEPGFIPIIEDEYVKGCNSVGYVTIGYKF
ncbi:MAG: PorT family protein [Bacteroidaceae bacterium]|nr:PorT family protein [Bacteroidaceae bacterium]